VQAEAPLPFIERRELLHRLRAEQLRFVTLAAPAGYGKTTVARQFASYFPRVATFDCLDIVDEADFIRGLTAALGHFFDSSFAHLRLAHAPSFDTAETLRALLIETWSRECGPNLVIFENAESLRAAEIDRSIFTRVLGSTRPERTIVFCTRAPLPFELHRFAPPHQAMTLTSEDLALRDEEATELFGDYVDDVESIRRVQEISRGWPIAVLLLRRMATEGRLAETLRSAERREFKDLYGYLSSEVMAKLDSEALDLLILVASLPNATLLDLEFLGVATTRASRSALASLPFVRIENGRISVHPLLLESLRSEHTTAMDAALRDAAAKLLEDGHDVRAAQFYAHANDLESAAASLARTPPYVFSNSLPACADVIDRLDADMICRYPALWVSTAPLRCFAVDTRRYLSEAEQVWFSLPLDVDEQLRVGVAIEYCSALAADGRLAECDAVVDAEVTRLGDTSPNLRGALLFHLAGRYGVRGAFAKARALVAATGQAQELTFIRGRVLDKIEAHEAFLSGRFNAGIAMLEQSLRLARRSGAAVALHSTLANAAFFCWLFGEDGRLEDYVSELERNLLPGLERGFAELIAAARGKWVPAPGPAALEVYRACAALIACTTSSGVDRLSAARTAISSARHIQDHFLLTLAHICEALISAEPPRTKLTVILESAAPIDSVVFKEAIVAIFDDRRTFLQPFIDRLVAVPRHQVGSLAVNILSGIVKRDGTPLKLTDLELTLVAVLSSQNRSFRRDELIDTIWPTLDESDARNSLKVCIHRVRQKLGENSILLDEGMYRLTPSASVDLRDIEVESRKSRLREIGETERENVRLALHSLTNLRPYPKAPEWFAELERRVSHLHRELSLRLGLEALKRRAFDDAQDIAHGLASRDLCDEEACEIIIRANLLAGNRSGAIEALRSYATTIRRELDVEPSKTLLRLLDEPVAP
jgi:DNA-binding SARP family transcriptional activator